MTTATPVPNLREQRKSSRYERVMNRAWCAIVGSGILPKSWPGKPRLGSTTLKIRGRRSGIVRTIPVTWVEVDGERYLVAMLGEQSDWVHNARAVDGRVRFRRGRTRGALITELPVDERAPILQAWYRRVGRSTPHKYIGLDSRAPLEEFERIASKWPVFRIESPGAMP
ncbi:MAG: nitroreductase/quinone reductase family protein [Chloroflexota bacterium]